MIDFFFKDNYVYLYQMIAEPPRERPCYINVTIEHLVSFYDKLVHVHVRAQTTVTENEEAWSAQYQRSKLRKNVEKK